MSATLQLGDGRYMVSVAGDPNRIQFTRLDEAVGAGGKVPENVAIAPEFEIQFTSIKSLGVVIGALNRMYSHWEKQPSKFSWTYVIERIDKDLTNLKERTP